jgi:hypothetical protein
VNTILSASMKPCRDVIWLVGSTTRIATIGTPYIRACAIPARSTAAAMSRRGSRISSAAVDGNSTPTNQ